MDVEVVRAPDNAQALERLHSYVVLDTETTGKSNTDEIVEIAILTVTNDKITDEYSTLINGKDVPHGPGRQRHHRC